MWQSVDVNYVERLDVGSHEQRKTFHARDAGACTGRYGCIAIVAHRPESTAVFRPARFARSKRDRQGHLATVWRPDLNGCCVTVEAAIDPATESHHQNDSQNRKD